MVHKGILDAAAQIQGWMTPAELRWLAERASTARSIAEIGCWKGRSTLVLAGHTLGRVYAIDHWQGQLDNPTSGPSLEIADRGAAPIRAEFDQHLAPYQDRVIVLPCPSLAVAAWARACGLQFDFVFIDGAHEEAAVEADILAYRPLLAPGGLLAGHDYGGPWHPGVTKAVDRLIGPVGRLDQIWWAR